MASEPVWSREVWGEGMVRGCFGCGGGEGGGGGTGKRTSRDWKDVMVMFSRVDSFMVASLGGIVG